MKKETIYVCDICNSEYETAEAAILCENSCKELREESFYVLCFSGIGVDLFVGALTHIDDDFVCSLYKKPFDCVSEDKKEIQDKKKSLGKFGKACKIRKISTIYNDRDFWEFADA